MSKDFGKDLKAIVSQLRKGKTAEIAESIPGVVGGLKALVKDRPKLELKNLALVIRGLLSGFQRRDYVLMADLIEYEILPFLQKSTDNHR
ncbi:MAG: hypothetical protein GF375_04155 [Candidatus Omnitrophica bacterium]|nr:hypothetical protein [Candidatus Omnitrophota bacterium]MBD3269242.1 hypothetical protein [Candidatus Omnitrophota bacterium]